MRAILTLAATVAFVISPLVSEPFSGFRADQLPIAQIDPPVQPAGYAFAIWGVIYLWLMVSAIYGVAKRREDPAWDKVRPALMLSLTIGAAWIPIALQNAIGATVLIWAMFLTAVMALFQCPKSDRLWLQMPIALYAGWLTAASSVSIGILGAGYGIILGQTGWAIIGIFIALNVGLLVLVARKQAPEYVLALIWALVGIIVTNQMMNPLISVLCALGILLLGLKALGNFRSAS